MFAEYIKDRLDNSCSYIQRGAERQKEIECPHPTLRLVKNTRSGWGGEIRTHECSSQSAVSYRLTTPQYYNSVILTQVRLFCKHFLFVFIKIPCRFTIDVLQRLKKE